AGQHAQRRQIAERGHGRAETGNPVRVLPHVVDKAEGPQSPFPRDLDVLRERAGTVGEGRVDVEVLVQRDVHVTASPRASTSAGSMKRSSRNRTTASSRKSR